MKGYNFTGWRCSYNNRVVGVPYASSDFSEDITYTAVFEVNQYPYIVRYLEEGTNKVLATEKTGANTNFGTQVTENAIDITNQAVQVKV